MPLFGLDRITPEKAGGERKLVVVKSRCPQNHPCPSLRVCPTGALRQQGFAAPTVEQGDCVRCGKCVRYCPRGALQLVD